MTARKSPASRRPLLRELALRAGIIPEYLDQTGKERRQTSDATRLALLRVMGFEAGTEAEAGSALEELDAKAAAQMLSPVRVVRIDDAGLRSVPVILPEGVRGSVNWSLELTLEGGGTRRARGTARRSAKGTITAELPDDPPTGYHSLRLELGAEGGTHSGEQSLIVVPPRCPDPAELLRGQRVFGVVANLYTVRSERNWGVGDFEDLRFLLEWAAGAGAAFVGVNPLHALRNRGGDISPYSPISRLYRNPLYIAAARVPEMESSAEAKELTKSEQFRSALERLRASDAVQYEKVTGLARPVLDALHAEFVRKHAKGATDRGKAYAAFVKEQGEVLERFATFQALSEWIERSGSAGKSSADWREWPDEYRDPRSTAVAEFRRKNAGAVEFHQWLQFEIDVQLAAVAETAREAGMPIGLYQDLAIGTSPLGSDPWMFPELFATGASVGAPPDLYSKSGQNWGLPPMNPHALAEDRYRYWIRLVRGSLRHAGALRIDHVIGLFRQFWIPEGKTGKDGAYVRFPVDDLMGIIALESTRAGALVVGEDLGTVPPEVPPGLERWGLLSSKVLYFEREKDGRFKSPATYAADALATANTHDMATLAGFWRARDVDLLLQVGLIENERAAKRARRNRNEELDALIARLAAAGIVPKGTEITSDTELRSAVHMMLRRTPSWLVGLSLDDLVGEVEPVNIPGVGPDHFPSWTRRLTMPLEQLRTDPGVRRALGCERAWVADRYSE